MRVSSICGGVMSFSMMKRGMKKYGAYYGMMSFVMRDTQYKRWVKYKKQGNEKMAKKVFDRWGISQI